MLFNIASINQKIMKYAKKFTNYGLSLSITQLIGLLVICNIASCSKCSPGTPDSSKMTVQVDKDHLQGDEKAAIIFGNSGDKEGPVIKPNDYTLQATISNEQGGTGSKLVYTDQQGAQKMEPTIDAPLTDLLQANRTALAGQATQTINLGIAPGTGVTALAINLEIFEAGASIYKKTIDWSEAPKPQPGQLAIVDITSAIANKDGQFFVQAIDGDVDPEKVEISWMSNTVASFVVGEQDYKAGIKLADVLGNNASIAKGDKAGPITWKVKEANSQDKATITLSLKRDGQEIGTGTIQWNKAKPGYDLSLSLAYDQANKKVTYKITNNGDAIPADKKLKLEVHNKTVPSKGFAKFSNLLKAKTKGNGYKMKLLGLGSKAKKTGAIEELNFNHKPSIELEFVLKVGTDEPVKQSLTCENPDPVQLKFDSKDNPHHIKTKADAGNFQTVAHEFTIENIGEVEVNLEEIKIKYILSTSTSLSQFREVTDKKEILKKGEVHNIKLSSIPMKNASKDVIHLYLFHHGKTQVSDLVTLTTVAS